MIFDYVRRFLIVFILALCVSFLILSGRQAKAEVHDISQITESWIFPVEGYITDAFGTRSGHHKGIDIGGEVGSPVYSVDEGVIKKSYYSDSYGNVVFVQHPSGYETVYAHLHNRQVTKGQAVRKGEQIGSLGNTGRSTGAHLHFEIHNGEWNITKDHAVDPFNVYGDGEIGQVVVALEHDPYKAVEMTAPVNAPLKEENSKQSKQMSRVHTVKEKEMLWSIAQLYNISVEDLKEKNNISNSTIVVNDVLSIPKDSKMEYVVKKGDTLTSIAKNNNVTLSSLLEWNGLTSKQNIFPEQVLVVYKN
jgi:murein DD-endopeptidase MepM/ murein hydrolase activator NlpD